MAWYDNMVNALGNAIVAAMSDNKAAVRERDYYNGKHPEQLKRKSGSYNDNLTINYSGLAVARSISRLFSGGIKFKLPDGSDKQAEYLASVWDTNKQEQLLYQLALNGAVYGTPFLKIVPDGAVNLVTGEAIARLIALDPEITRVEVDPFDLDDPEQYIIEFEADGKGYKEITRKSKPGEFGEALNYQTWVIEHYILNERSGKWEVDPNNPPVQWPYDFPPIIHWKNMPSLKASHGAYGATNNEWALDVQDKLNFGESNINKTIRLMAAPPTIATGVRQKPEFGTGPGSFTWFSEPEAKVYNLTANADISGSREWAGDLQSAIFHLSREVPPSVIEQLGSGLTNFVMRVIFADALDKTDTQRALYGDAILEINRRLLVLAGYEGEQSNPGTLEWGDALPKNPLEQIQKDKFLLDNGLASKQTIAGHYGIDFEAEKAVIDEEQAASTNNIGAFLLSNFNRGGQ